MKQPELPTPTDEQLRRTGITRAQYLRALEDAKAPAPEGETLGLKEALRIVCARSLLHRLFIELPERDLLERERQRMRGGLSAKRTGIVSLIGRFVDLRPAGRNFKGFCPFCCGKMPNFCVSPERRIFHCFDCHLGGGSFRFLLELGKISLQILFGKLPGITYTSGATERSARLRDEGR